MIQVDKDQNGGGPSLLPSHLARPPTPLLLLLGQEAPSVPLRPSSYLSPTGLPREGDGKKPVNCAQWLLAKNVCARDGQTTACFPPFAAIQRSLWCKPDSESPLCLLDGHIPPPSFCDIELMHNPVDSSGRSPSQVPHVPLMCLDILGKMWRSGALDKTL